MTTIDVYNPETGETDTVPMTPAQEAAYADMLAQQAKAASTVTPAEQEHAETLLVVQQRASEDPAYAALARLTLPPEIARTLPA